jgi:hypothetical protein
MGTGQGGRACPPKLAAISGEPRRVGQVGRVGQVVRVGQVGRVTKVDWFLTTIVLLHLAISIVHGQAHAGAAIPLPLASTLFVYIVILAGPLAGLALTRWRPVAGAWVVAASFGGALVFGLINHFVIAGPDHVDHVAAAWRGLFRATALLLVASEAIGVAVAIRSAIGSTARSSS